MALNFCYHPLDVLKACRKAAKTKTSVTVDEDTVLVNMGNMDFYSDWTSDNPTKFAVERAVFFDLPLWIVIAIDRYEDALNAEAAADDGDFNNDEVMKWRDILAGVSDD